MEAEKPYSPPGGYRPRKGTGDWSVLVNENRKSKAQEQEYMGTVKERQEPDEYSRRTAVLCSFRGTF